MALFSNGILVVKSPRLKVTLMSAPLNEIFCSACANPLIATAVICPKCGSPTSNYNQGAKTGKSKVVAVLLAVFFGTWAWLYTYSASSLKFWFTSAVTFLLSIVLWNSSGFSTDLSYARNLVSIQSWIAFAAIIAGFYLWVIFDYAAKKDE
ncbi:MAG: hypothetical protein EBT26_07500, partial [Microbacteriaceae bacterium]|nr:hypothetical protein [Microbacteriaceae bacterium]